MKSKQCHWLILSYRSNIDGSACAQHLDDRLPFFENKGITPVLLTGPVGKKFESRHHYRAWSIAPSGIRFELRHFLRKHLLKRWQFKTVETVLLIPILPFYLLEKIIINLESEWSWLFLASIRGYILCHRYSPEVIYSTGGTASAHVAARILSMITGLPWLAEAQDPLVHDHEWRRGKRVLAVYKWLERAICRKSESFIFLTQAARDNMAARTGMQGCGKVIYPGGSQKMFASELYKKRKRCHFAHFGTLNGSRNLIVFFKALNKLIEAGDVEPDSVIVDLYGSLDGGTETIIRQLDLENLVRNFGQVPRKKALIAMQKSDCLILVQNTIFFSSETIPSKVYEYLMSGRPTLGLLYKNEELYNLLNKSGNFPVAADDIDQVNQKLRTILDLHSNNRLVDWHQYEKMTVANAVDQIVNLGNEASRSTDSNSGLI